MDQSPPSTLHVSCILLWYPLFTQPFIFREIEGLRRHATVSVHTLYGPNHSHCSHEMLEAAKTVHTAGIRVLPGLLASLGREIFTHPVRFFRLVSSHLFRRWPSLEIFGENLWAFCMAFHLAPLIAKEHCDVLYAPWPRGTAQTAWMLSKLLGIPFVMTVRGDNLLPSDPDLDEKMRDAACIRANNAADVPRIETFGTEGARGKTHLVYNCLTLEGPSDRPPHISDYTPARPLALMALGRFDVTKGFPDLIRACAILQERGLNFTLTLAGGGGFLLGLGSLEEKLRTLVRELHLSDRVSFPGLISHNELPDILARHDIFIAPCVIDASGKRDGIPNTLLEAMSQKVPVIATNIHALPEIVRHNETGLLVPPSAPEAIAEAVLTLAADPAKAAALGTNAAAFVARLFSPERNARLLADLLAQAKYGPTAHARRTEPDSTQTIDPNNG